MEEEKIGHIDLAELIRLERINTIESLRASIESIQERLVAKFERLGWRRSRTTYEKRVVTMLGEVRFTVIKVRRLEDDGRSRFASPILNVLSIRRRKYSREVKMTCVDMAASMSYGETSRRVRHVLNLEIPKRTIHSFVQEIGTRMAKAHKGKERKKQVNGPSAVTNNLPTVVMGDGTKTHSIYQTNNDVRVAISYSNDGQTKLLGLAVNDGWESIPKPSGPHVLVSDGERSIVDNLASDPDHTQLDLVHAERDAMFKLWGEGMSKEQRDIVSRDMNRILFTLVNSVNKHGQQNGDGDVRAIEARVESTLTELKGLAENLSRRGYAKGAEFISRNARLMVTFAKLAVQGIDIPYTSNVIERLMGTIAARCKHHWMHWSTRGLENMLWILLVRYTDEQEYESFRQAYIHPFRREQRSWHH